MIDDRLPAALEASSLLRRAEVVGGFAMIVARGDPDRGALVVLVAHRGAHVACLERELGGDGNYTWHEVGPAVGATDSELQSWSRRRRAIDPDTWLIELDVPLPQQFIAQIVATG